MSKLFNTDESIKTPKQMDREKRKLKAYELRVKGYTFDEIAHELGCAKSTAFELVKDAQKDTLDTQTTNLNYLRLERIAAIDLLVKSRFQDLNGCVDVEGDDGRLYRDGLKTRGFVVRDILTLLQEKSRLEGLYDNSKVDSFIETDVTEGLNYDNMTDAELSEAFADIMREQMNSQ